MGNQQETSSKKKIYFFFDITSLFSQKKKISNKVGSSETIREAHIITPGSLYFSKKKFFWKITSSVVCKNNFLY